MTCSRLDATDAMLNPAQCTWALQLYGKNMTLFFLIRKPAKSEITKTEEKLSCLFSSTKQVLKSY